jgi:hypothetical protein
VPDVRLAVLQLVLIAERNDRPLPLSAGGRPGDAPPK